MRPPPESLARVLAPFFRGAFQTLGGFRVAGVDHVPARGPAILAPNHRSWADPPAVRLALRRHAWFMANESLFRIPLFGGVISALGAFPVRRGVLDRDAIRQAELHLKAGDLVCVFPEGGTTITGRLYPFEGGVALLAIRNDVPVVPVALTGTDGVLPPGRPIPRYARGGVTVTFGPPLHPRGLPAGLPRREQVAELTSRLYLAVAALLPPGYVPDPLPEEMSRSV